ncbi:hypothetical protein SLE2022_082750 [Rubroshorea leprosula]
MFGRRRSHLFLVDIQLFVLDSGGIQSGSVVSCSRTSLRSFLLDLCNSDLPLSFGNHSENSELHLLVHDNVQVL